MSTTTDVIDESSTSSNMVPQERINEITAKKNALSEENIQLKAQLEASQAKPGAIQEVDPTSVEEIARLAVENHFKQVNTANASAALKASDAAYLASLGENLPTPDLEDLSSWAQDKGIKSLEDAYKLKFQDDIIDSYLKTGMKANKGLVGQTAAQSVNEADVSEKIAAAKTPEELAEIMRSIGE